MSIPLSEDTPLFAAALELAAKGVALTPGSYAGADGQCSCEDPGCRRPGAHPLMPNWLHRCSARPILLAQWWSGEWSNANLIVPLTGRFDVLDVPPSVADDALRHACNEDPGNVPVVSTPSGRRQVWVKAGAAIQLPDRLRGRLPFGSRPDLRIYHRGFYVMAPPSRLGCQGVYGWQRPLTGHIDTLTDAEPVIDAVVEAYLKIMIV